MSRSLAEAHGPVGRVLKQNSDSTTTLNFEYFACIDQESAKDVEREREEMKEKRFKPPVKAKPFVQPVPAILQD